MLREKEMIKRLLFIMLTGSTFSLEAQSYEGQLAGEYVWFDLSMSSASGEVKGSYFYKKEFITISLSGKKRGTSISLIEKGNKNKITGSMTLADFGDSLSGIWENPKKSKKFNVTLYKTDPIYKPRKKLEIGEPESPGNDSDGFQWEKSRTLLFVRKNIVSFDNCWNCSGGNYPIGDCTYYTFFTDSTGTHDLQLWNEIGKEKLPQFKEFVFGRVQKALDEMRNRQSDTEWLELLGDRRVAGTSTAFLDTLFQWSDEKLKAVRFDYYFEENALHIFVHDYFHFPHVLEASDLFCTIEIPLADMAKYLAENSVLQRLVNNP
jgi:hypothetical protein